ncbi:hypothetical protein BDN72DRAFT_899160 [Pluteus cervinus]|uniref:Uncharacterized protein n=1 Tax=Pluteus cervinus TaxID=181527 RepID=A0ACD3ANY5_9AGAR|nr:hypothetical protein BDN72DRAFT_899160 [Pluteus cervinus]
MVDVIAHKNNGARQPTGINRLPPEVLSRVFLHLSPQLSSRACLAVTRTCRRYTVLREVARVVQLDLTLAPALWIDVSSYFKCTAPLLESFSLSSKSRLPRNYRESSHIQVIVLSDDLFAGVAPNLTSATFIKCAVDVGSPIFHGLTTLTIEDPPIEFEPSPEEVLRALHRWTNWTCILDYLNDYYRHPESERGSDEGQSDDDDEGEGEQTSDQDYQEGTNEEREEEGDGGSEYSSSQEDDTNALHPIRDGYDMEVFPPNLRSIKIEETDICEHSIGGLIEAIIQPPKAKVGMATPIVGSALQNLLRGSGVDLAQLLRSNIRTW